MIKITADMFGPKTMQNSGRKQDTIQSMPTMLTQIIPFERFIIFYLGSVIMYL